MSQTELCEGICSPSTISQLEGDKFIPSIEILKKISDRLALPLHELLATQEQQMELKVQIEIVCTYVESKNYQSALALANHLLKRDDLMEHQKRELLFNKAECLIWMNDFSTAVKLLQQLQKKMEMEREPEDRNLAKILNKLGTAYYYAQDNPNAYANYLRAYQIVMRFPEFDLFAAGVTYNLGNICRAMGYDEDAVFYLNLVRDKLKDYENPQILARTFFALGISYSNLGQLELASDYLIKSQTYYEMVNSIHFVQLVKQKYAFDILSNQRLDEAILELKSCKNEYVRLGDVSGICYIIARLTMLYMEHGIMEDVEKELEEGLVLIEQAKGDKNKSNEIDTQINTSGQFAYFYRACAKFALLNQNYENAIHYSNKSSEIFAKMGFISDSAESLQIAAETYFQSGDLHQAYLATKEVNDLLITNRRRRQI